MWELRQSCGGDPPQAPRLWSHFAVLPSVSGPGPGSSFVANPTSEPPSLLFCVSWKVRYYMQTAQHNARHVSGAGSMRVENCAVIRNLAAVIPGQVSGRLPRPLCPSPSCSSLSLRGSPFVRNSSRLLEKQSMFMVKNYENTHQNNQSDCTHPKN